MTNFITLYNMCCLDGYTESVWLPEAFYMQLTLKTPNNNIQQHYQLHSVEN